MDEVEGFARNIRRTLSLAITKAHFCWINSVLLIHILARQVCIALQWIKTQRTVSFLS